MVLVQELNDIHFSQLLSHSDYQQANFHLKPSFTFFKHFRDESQLQTSNIVINNRNHLNLLSVEKESQNSGQAWASIKMTNNLPAGVYTVLFELFSYYNGILNDETLITHVYGDSNYKTIVTFTHDYRTSLNKAVIQFTSNGQPGEITFGKRYYGSSYS